MKKYLLLKGCAGIGNRLITASYAAEQANALGRSLCVDWTDGQFAENGINSFDRYFKLANVSDIATPNEVFDKAESGLAIYPAIWRSHIRKSFYDVFSPVGGSHSFMAKISKAFPTIASRIRQTHWRLNPAFSQEPTYCSAVPGKNFFLHRQPLMEFSPLASFHQDILVVASYLPPFSKERLRKYIHILPQWNKQARTIAHDIGIGADTVGIHVRFTDKEPDASIDKLVAFIKTSETCKGKSIFLATDSLSVQNLIAQVFPKIIIMKKFLPDTGDTGLHRWALLNEKHDKKTSMADEAMLEMLLLSLCPTLIRQEGSSFSLMSNCFSPHQQISIAWDQLP